MSETVARHAQAVRTTTRPRRRGLVISALIVLAALGAWQLATAALHLETWVLPTPVEVAAAFTQPDTQALIVDNLWPTLEEAAVGFAICVGIGVGLAAAMASSRVVRDGLYPLLIASQAIPIIAIAAVLVVVLGYGLAPKVVVVVLFSFFAITVNVYDALQTLDPDLPGCCAPWERRAGTCCARHGCPPLCRASSRAPSWPSRTASRRPCTANG